MWPRFARLAKAMSRDGVRFLARTGELALPQASSSHS